VNYSLTFYTHTAQMCWRLQFSIHHQALLKRWASLFRSLSKTKIRSGPTCKMKPPPPVFPHWATTVIHVSPVSNFYRPHLFPSRITSSFSINIHRCPIGSSDFGTLIYFKLIWIAEKILRSNYKISFSLLLAISCDNGLFGSKNKGFTI
jgi:hypothetical protein